MSKVYPVDQKMVEQTRSWLLGQRDGQGGFKRERRALHTWITDADVSNAYITWALLEAGETNPTLSEEIASLNEAAAKSDNLYVVALAANVQSLAGEDKAAKALLDRLAKDQAKDGSVEGKQSIVGSGSPTACCRSVPSRLGSRPPWYFTRNGITSELPGFVTIVGMGSSADVVLSARR